LQFCRIGLVHYPKKQQSRQSLNTAPTGVLPHRIKTIPDYKKLVSQTANTRHPRGKSTAIVSHLGDGIAIAH